MENASKALIIAGAILLAILIIGLAVFIYNQASNTVSDTGMDQVAVKFEQYINREIGSTQTQALIDTVQESNRTSGVIIDLPEISNKNDIIVGHRYIADAGTNEYGVLNCIKIHDVTNSGDSGVPTVVEPEHNITEGVDDFNARFSPFLGKERSIFDVKSIDEAVRKANDIFGNGTVSIIENKVPMDAIIDNYDIGVADTYSDGYIKEIEIRANYHFEESSDK